MTFEEISKKFIGEELASDLHIRPNWFPNMRVNGKMVKFYDKMTPEQTKQFCLDLLASKYQGKERMLEEAVDRLTGSNAELDISFSFFDGTRTRGSIFYTNGELGAVLRKIPKEIPVLEKIGIDPRHLHSIEEVLSKKEGLCLITGQTGSGKSTTLAAFVNKINQTRNAHIITIEDPIEFFHTNNQCVITHREVGDLSDTKTFGSGLKASLRQDPDIILIGELRDAETTMAAIQAAQTGHIVLATLHTNRVSESVTRIVDMFPADKAKAVKASLAESLGLIFSQRLIPNKQGGRTLAYEFSLNNNTIKNSIRAESISTTNIDTNIREREKDGKGILLNKNIVNLCNSGKLDPMVALEYTYDKEELRGMLNMRQESGTESTPSTPW